MQRERLLCYVLKVLQAMINDLDVIYSDVNVLDYVNFAKWTSSNRLQQNICCKKNTRSLNFLVHGGQYVASYWSRKLSIIIVFIGTQ